MTGGGKGIFPLTGVSNVFSCDRCKDGIFPV